jgi:hypothetical protein
MLNVIDPMSLLKWLAMLLILMKKTSKYMYSSAAKVCLTSLCYILVGLLSYNNTCFFFPLSFAEGCL